MAPAVEQRAVAVLALPDRVDLGLELRAPARRGPRARSAATASLSLASRCVGLQPARSAAARRDCLARCSIRLSSASSSASSSSERCWTTSAFITRFSRHSTDRCGSLTPAPAASRRSGRAAASAACVHHGIFAGPVRDVDQRDVGCAPVLVGGMVPQVGGDVGLHTRARDDVEQRVARAPAHRDPRHRRRRSRPTRAPPTTCRAARRARGRRTPTTAPASAVRRSGPARHRRAPAPARRCRTRAPRRGARPASPRAHDARSRAGAITSTRSSATRSTVPTLPIVGDAPSCGRNCPVPDTLQLQCE